MRTDIEGHIQFQWKRNQYCTFILGCLVLCVRVCVRMCVHVCACVYVCVCGVVLRHGLSVWSSLDMNLPSSSLSFCGVGIGDMHQHVQLILDF
jgi:hypothetical protein